MHVKQLACHVRALIGSSRTTVYSIFATALNNTLRTMSHNSRMKYADRYRVPLCASLIVDMLTR